MKKRKKIFFQKKKEKKKAPRSAAGPLNMQGANDGQARRPKHDQARLIHTAVGPCIFKEAATFAGLFDFFRWKREHKKKSSRFILMKTYLRMNPDTDKKISLFQEKWVKLYLRLNGYFTTGFIVHSLDKGDVETEVDIMGIRFPFNEQLERKVANSAYLHIPDNIDIIIGEVKMRKTALQFNEPIRIHDNREENWRKMLKWIGLFNADEVEMLIPYLVALVQTNEKSTPDEFLNHTHEGRYGKITLRPMLFAPDRPEPRPNQPRYVHGQEMMDFIWQCLNPEELREHCATDYSVDVWGDFMDIVQLLKTRHKDKVGPCTMDDLYKELVTVEASTEKK